MNKKIAVTIGDPNSIGAEIAVKAINSCCVDNDKIILFANSKILKFYNLQIAKNIEFVDIDFDISQITVGQNSAAGGDFAYRTLKCVLEGIKKYNLKSLVTAPVSKYALSLAGYEFSGQTEILQKFLGNDIRKAQMLFCANDFRVMLLTRHVPLSEVRNKLNENLLFDSISELNSELKRLYKIKSPKIALCALNPHAGENGVIGRDEIDILIPAVDALLKNGIDVSYPQPSDALFKKAGKNFLEHRKQDYDCFVSCYHDQGLCAIKPLAQEMCVNTTIGLEILRTSPSHGTAFDISGKNLADATSMVCALKSADI